jgi:molybdopterin-containing oxidoreductase family membrane subunit
MSYWPNFRSPLVWDVFAVTTYLTISLVFWFVGLIPDLATLRDRSQSRTGQIIYGMLAMGWRGSARHWHRYDTAYLLLAGLATPLVVSVHTVVSFDFAIAIVPGWHTTIFPPYFVAGAIYSGFAMVLSLAIPIRAVYGLEDFITLRHFENMAKLLLAMGLIVSYSYIVELFFAWYSGDQYAAYIMGNRASGAYALMFWTQILCNVITPQALWCKRVRSSLPLLFSMAIIINIGMWVERYVIVITSLHRDYLPSSWAIFTGTIWDWATFIGSFGLFSSLMFLFIRFLPVISMTEMRKLLPQAKVNENEA